ncbi:TetR/AcrR family transcriptional regulator [Clostridium sp. KNHs205]|jgi:AcrR family transcriptional regulator|uniref:TetR/AcrR family transcriptional regulator n=1 Tax=Clostridium sp. KNHs205 TaxID=1449050 RepID=UPI00051C709A|nr:TetR/AcrR family transcriptional regulator [Clostridium sp. KNHs205]
MPKLIDSKLQKARIAKAAWRVIQSEGIENASVRKIANEAGISPGTLQHNFKTQSQLLKFAMEQVVEHINQRVTEFNQIMPELNIQNAKLLLLNLVPMNGEQELEAEVWLALTLKSLHEPELMKIKTETYQAMQQLLVALLGQLYAAGFLKESIQLEKEAVKLQLLLDALALHRMLSPENMTPEVMKDLISQHMDELSVKKENIK